MNLKKLAKIGLGLGGGLLGLGALALSQIKKRETCEDDCSEQTEATTAEVETTDASEETKD